MADKLLTDEGVLSRWSRRKLEPQTDNEEKQGSEQVQKKTVEIEATSTDEETVPIWQQEDVDADTKKTALAALFRQPEFNDVDHLNEYDEDFTNFNPLGKLVTQEMKRMLALAEQETRPDIEDKIIEDDVKTASPQPIEIDNNNEDDKLA